MRFKKIFNETQYDNEEIFLKDYINGHYNKNADGSIDVTGNVKIFDYKQKNYLLDSDMLAGISTATITNSHH